MVMRDGGCLSLPSYPSIYWVCALSLQGWAARARELTDPGPSPALTHLQHGVDSLVWVRRVLLTISLQRLLSGLNTG